MGRGGQGPLLSRRRELALNLGLAAASLGLCLGLLEIAARIAVAHRKPGKEVRVRRLYQVHDPVLGWRKRPGARVTYDRPEFTVEMVMNGHGQRDRERAWERPAGGFRVLALGDSFVEGYTVPLAETVTQQLEARLGGPRCATAPEVLNTGTTGWSTDQEYLYYRDEGHRYGAQVVLLFVYYNDVLYNARDNNLGLPKPLLGFRGGTPAVRNLPVPEAPAAAAPPPPRPPPPGPRSVALDLLGDRLERSAPGAYNAAARFGLWPPTRRVEPLPEMRVYSAKPDSELRHAWRATTATVLALRDEVARHGGRLAIVHVPSRLEISDPAWELTRWRYGIAEGRWQRDAVAHRWTEVANSAGVPLLDPSLELRAAEGLFRKSYLPLDGHWNARGHAVTAAAVHRFLLAHGLAPACR
jgi:lysophospholipase L1-like esterase